MCGWMATGTPQTTATPGITAITRGLLLKARRGSALATKGNSFLRGIGKATAARKGMIIAGTGINGTGIITGIPTGTSTTTATTAATGARSESRELTISGHMTGYGRYTSIQAAGKFISAANFGQRLLARTGSPMAVCKVDGTKESRSSIAFSYQSAARSISLQQMWKSAQPMDAP